MHTLNDQLTLHDQLCDMPRTHPRNGREVPGHLLREVSLNVPEYVGAAQPHVPHVPNVVQHNDNEQSNHWQHIASAREVRVAH